MAVFDNSGLCGIFEGPYKHRKKARLSKPALETLSIVVYKQPVTRAEIEAIRGVNVDGVMKVLLEKEFIRIAGRKDVPGKPIVYKTTNKFMQHFGLASLAELPKIDEFVSEHEVKPIEESDGSCCAKCCSGAK